MKCLENNRRNIDEHIHNYKKHKCGSEKGVNWDETMTRELCEGLLKSQCHYCGKKYEVGGYLLGIDRIDSKLGYTEDNCISCCRTCNFMKRTHSVERFLKICEHLIGYHGIMKNYDISPN